jgi:hypothetical protein
MIMSEYPAGSRGLCGWLLLVVSNAETPHVSTKVGEDAVGMCLAALIPWLSWWVHGAHEAARSCNRELRSKSSDLEDSTLSIFFHPIKPYYLLTKSCTLM